MQLVQLFAWLLQEAQPVIHVA